MTLLEASVTILSGILALHRRHEADRRARETGLPEVDEAVRDMLQGVRKPKS